MKFSTLQVASIFVVLFLSSSSSLAASSFQGDPYKVLGLTKEATQEEIRSSYRTLCLRYHPDKNVGKGEREKKRCTEMFKKIQAAHSLIGDPESRRAYDRQSSFSSPPGNYQYGGRHYGSTNNPYTRYQFRNEDINAFYRAFAEEYSRPTGRRQSDPDFFGKFSSADVFPNNFGKAPSFVNGASLKSIYIQKTKVRLQDLYKGRSNLEFKVYDSIWKSYCAAFRGGWGYLILYQSAIFALPLLRINKLASLAFAGFLFHMHVPRPKVLQYTANILPGFKEGTKITFREDDGFDMVFVLEEDPHERFTRRGNNLHTKVEILASQAKDGFTVELESLNPMDEPLIQVKLRPNQIQQSGDTITIKRKGWPQRKTGRTGDLIIDFQIVRKLSTGRKQSQKRKEGTSRRRKPK